MPRAALDPTELVSLLPNLLLIEVAAEAGLRIRLAGDEIERRYGRSLRGLPLAETFSLVERHDTSHQWQAILQDGRPKYRRGPMVFSDGRRFEAERLILPLSAGPLALAYLVGAIFYRSLPLEGDLPPTEAADLLP